MFYTWQGVLYYQKMILDTAAFFKKSMFFFAYLPGQLNAARKDSLHRNNKHHNVPVLFLYFKFYRDTCHDSNIDEFGLRFAFCCRGSTLDFFRLCLLFSHFVESWKFVYH